jgi:hypothetical protein
MKTTHHSLSTILLLLFCLDISYAKDYPIYAGIGTSFKNYSYIVNDKIRNNTYASDTLQSVKYTVGFIGSDNKFLVSVFGDNVISNNQLSPIGLSDDTLASLKRDDYGININYNITDKISVIGGYRYGVTSVDYKNISTNDEIKTYGPYIGARYLLFSKGNNKLFSSLNYNLLSTDFTLGGKEKFNFDGQGYALSLGWSHYLGNKNSLYIAAEYHNFDHDKMKNSNIQKELDFSLEESVYSTRIEFIHSFN